MESQKDLGVITALMERFEKERLPRALEIREKVGGGEKLSDLDLEFLERVLSDAKEYRPLVEEHPEYQKLVAKVVALYGEIAELAVQNEKAD